MRVHRKNESMIDTIEGDTIFLNGQGFFPKKLVIIEPKKRIEYRIVKSNRGKYQLNK